MNATTVYISYPATEMVHVNVDEAKSDEVEERWPSQFKGSVIDQR